jgi:hypothetical protein
VKAVRPTRHRPPVAGHIAFGTGIHGCVGQVVARLEGEAVLGALAARVASITIEATPCIATAPRPRALSSLPVRVVGNDVRRRDEPFAKTRRRGQETPSRIVRQDCANQVFDVLERVRWCPNELTVLQTFAR